jgi:hypothetical protein
MAADNIAASSKRQKVESSVMSWSTSRLDYVTDVEDDWDAEEAELASCYVAHISTRSRYNPRKEDGSMYETRSGRLVLSSKDEVRRWMELEFGSLKSLMLYLASGQDVLLQVVHGISKNIHVATDHSELLLSRINLTLCGIPIEFRNVRLLTMSDRNQFETEGWIPTPRRQVIDGILYYVQEMIGVDSYYEICVRSDSATIDQQHRQCCLCERFSANHHSTHTTIDPNSSSTIPLCGPTLFDCTTFQEELRGWRTTPPNTSSGSAPSVTPSAEPLLSDSRMSDCINLDVPDVPDLPSRPLRHGEALVFYDSDDGTRDEIRLGWTSNANTDQTTTIVDWKSFLYPVSLPEDDTSDQEQV